MEKSLLNGKCSSPEFKNNKFWGCIRKHLYIHAPFKKLTLTPHRTSTHSNFICIYIIQHRCGIKAAGERHARIHSPCAHTADIKLRRLLNLQKNPLHSLSRPKGNERKKENAQPLDACRRAVFFRFSLFLSLSPGFYDSSFFILCAPASLPPELCTCLLLLLLLLKSVAAARFFSSSMPALSFFFSPLLHNHEGWCAQQSFEWGDTERATVMRRASVMLSSYVHGCGALK